MRRARRPARAARPPGALSEAQTAALSTRDVEGVEALTRTLESTVLEGPALEQRRAGAAAGLAAALGLDPAR